MEARLLERGKTSGRADDNAAAIKKRFATYRAETMPVVGYYAQLGLVHTCVATAGARGGRGHLCAVGGGRGGWVAHASRGHGVRREATV